MMVRKMLRATLRNRPRPAGSNLFPGIKATVKEGGGFASITYINAFGAAKNELQIA
jgi:hypothetical protein